MTAKARTGARVNLAELAGQPPMPAPAPTVLSGTGTRAPRIEQVAPNPLNSRDLANTNAVALQELTESIRNRGQLDSCAVVTRDAFLRIYPEHAATVADYDYVQVSGGRRRLAILAAGVRTIDVTVKDSLAATRLDFLAATFEENLKREDLNPIEEATALLHMVTEAGTQTAVAEKMGKSPAWVTQRLDLLKLLDELQDLVRAGTMPLRAARVVAQQPHDRQTATWDKIKKDAAKLDDPPGDDPAADTAARPKPRTAAPTAGMTARRRAVRTLGKSPQEVARTLADTLPPDDIAVLYTALKEIIDGEAAS